MKTTLFILIYGAVVACVVFTLMTLFNLPSYASAAFAVPAVLLANRVGAGFGVRLFPEKSTMDTDNDPHAMGSEER
jgi:hypothetical protein